MSKEVVAIRGVTDAGRGEVGMILTEGTGVVGRERKPLDEEGSWTADGCDERDDEEGSGAGCEVAVEYGPAWNWRPRIEELDC